MYRISQEALNNIVRHAQASRAALRISYLPNSVRLEISDDGVGFEVPESPAEFAPSGHFGLLGIHERAETIGAKLEIHSRQAEGSQITVILPIQEMENRS